MDVQAPLSSQTAKEFGVGEMKEGVRIVPWALQLVGEVLNECFGVVPTLA